ncbi:MAG: major facilitator superfamily 1 [Pedosphaera sp.]|nr:major facilitator superfamily 1 [Pedosphaera sp.]
MVTFFLVASLFLLWGFCNGMIDTMDKHFQDQLNLTKAQSAWVQFAHYMGYAIMALPAGLLTRRLGYKGGIIFGLFLVAAGGFWFMPATHIAQFWAFLMGVCLIAMGLTVLETVANPYTTVLGPREFGATRINLAQSFNGIGWIFGPMVGAAYFYSEGGVEVAHGQIYIPYLGVGLVVLVLAILFFFAQVPDIKVEDDYHTDDTTPAASAAKPINRPLVLLMMVLNVAAVGLSIYLILNTILPSVVSEATFHSIQNVLPYVLIAGVLVAAFALSPFAKTMTTKSIWAHPHFSAATLAQFVYVAAQAGIFSFFINCMTSDSHTGFSMVPPIPAAWHNETTKKWIEVGTKYSLADIKDLPALADRLQKKSDPVSIFVATNLSAATTLALADYKGAASDGKVLSKDLVEDLNKIVKGKSIADPQLFAGITLQDKTQKLVAENPKNAAYLNRLLLSDSFPRELGYQDGVLRISDKGAAMLASIGFICFLIGRVSGAAFLKKFSAHKVLGLYGLINVGVCALIIGNLGWLSVVGVFLSYLFMSIMFPTIFALGIHGLGSQAKKKASAFIVMSITGGALMPKFMGYLGDEYNMCFSFWMPLVCFVAIALYGFSWTKLSQSEGLQGVDATGGHAIAASSSTSH